MDNKIIAELLDLVRKSDLSEIDKRKYVKVVMLTARKFDIEAGGLVKDNPELMQKLLESYEKKKEIIRNKDKAAWKNLMKNEGEELETMIIEDLKNEEDGQLAEIRAKLKSEL